MNTTSFLLAVVGIAVATLGAFLLTRTRKQQVREEVGHAAHVLAQFPEPAAFPGARRTTPDPEPESEPVDEGRREPVVEPVIPSGWPQQGPSNAYPSQGQAYPWPPRDERVPEPMDFAELARTSRQEAEIYLEHHHLALKHHATYQQASLWAGVLGFAIVLVGGVLTYVAGLDVGVVTALAGALPAVAAGLLFRQANLVADRAAENLRGLETSVRRFNSVQAAKEIADQIADVPTRNRMYEMIGQQLLADQAR
ncbi:hypothetical protein GCM10029976_061990 [Kribbella albertanoniae]|uniref:Cyanobacterial TRADD-N associated 2 transmembrane domain-containing protein n=1 Tax=Kribbella albertanoniae TaxID=1266829 RepID=A0A4V2XNB8_9ACTN|nr:hypothetical protein [Kribbella albertanoniae]TDC17596.1 hypothetical protein E1261_36785 [Kribbella albertanoniae]